MNSIPKIVVDWQEEAEPSPEFQRLILNLLTERRDDDERKPKPEIHGQGVDL